MVRSVTRQIEPEWDAQSQQVAEGLSRYDDECCQGCGLHKSILDDPEHNAFTFEERICKVCAGQEVYGRTVAERDEKARQAAKDRHPHDPRPSDGRHIIMRRLSEEEIARVRDRRRRG